MPRLRAAPWILALAPAAWILLDLVLRLDLPGAPWLSHRAFRLLVGPLEWLTEGSGERLGVVLVVWAALAAPAAVFRWRAFASLTAVPIASMQILLVVLGLLMERGLGLGVAAAAGTAASLGALPPPRAPHRRLALALGAVVGLLACAYVYSLFMTRGEGYPLLQAAGRAVRGGGFPLLELVCLLAVAAVGAAAWWRRDSLNVRLLAALGSGLGVAAAARLLLGEGGPWGSMLPALALGLTVVALGRPLLSWGAGGPTSWPVRLVPATLIGLMLLGHAYAGRVLRCPADDAPHLRRLGSPSEIFRLKLAGTGAVASLREGGQIARVDLATGVLSPAAAGPIGRGDRIEGTPEELVQAGDRWFASFLSPRPADWLEADAPWGIEAHNALAELDATASAVIAAHGLPGLCWVNTLHWGPPHLYIGCEDRPGLHRWDPATASLVDANLDPRLGDVQDLALHPDGRRLFTISLWFSDRLSELSRDDLSVLRQTALGGSHYHLAHDPHRDRLYASAWYGGRVRVLDADTLSRLRPLPVGLGARPVEVLPAGRLLVASAYDGLMRISDGDRVLGRLPVGGHVKDIAYDPARDRAWFWSQCGLFELDVAGWLAELSP